MTMIFYKNNNAENFAQCDEAKCTKRAYKNKIKHSLVKKNIDNEKKKNENKK